MARWFLLRTMEVSPQRSVFPLLQMWKFVEETRKILTQCCFLSTFRILLVTIVTSTNLGDRAQPGFGEDTAQPWDLCRAIASKLALQLQEEGIQCQPLHLRPKRPGCKLCVPLLACNPDVEFQQITTPPAHLPLPSNSRKLSTPHQEISAWKGLQQP